MLIKDLEGLRFPDDYVIRFFFKEGLNRKRGRVLELGCGNGNNLLMFYQYGWEVAGVDNNKDSIRLAKTNFNKCQNYYKLTNKFSFFIQDMVRFCATYKGYPFDVLLLPGSIYYLDYKQIIKLFSKIREERMINHNSLIFIRTRSPADYRYARGRKIGEKTFRLNIKETGEWGCLCTFLQESELNNILEDNFTFAYKRFFRCDFDNYQIGYTIANSDIIFWGKIGGVKK